MLDLSPPSTTSSQFDITSTASRRKTRNSCDACAKSKVRCGKQHPRCDRCVLRNQACTYGLARPKGRPRLSHRSPSISPPCSTGLDLNILSTLYDPEPTPDIYLNCFSEDTFTSTANLISPDSQHLEDWQFLDHELVLPFDKTTPQPTFTQQPVQPSYQMDLALSLASPLPHSSPASLPGPSNSSEHAQSCTSLILDTLRTLSLPLGSCRRNATVPPCPSLDTLLRLNKEAMDIIKVVVECDCSVEPYLSTLVAEVLTKILRWYHKIILDFEYLDCSIPTVLLCPPMRIGEFELSKRDSRWVVAQVVTNELDKVQALVETFERRFCYFDEPDEYHEVTVCTAFEAGLRESLKNIRSQAVERMAG
ncbi:uncharacterized protein BO88DRAFT_444598 [Aspergillus vadensis CBS 113365]|uniref:Zn(2)-C6 fungal-type domain-containing protein n=1 Tax=Aspergillus vadensis (strain CBS 113365 / IMI 142717 / IBT 24658) TaxID=1448311 RepID=A0A319BRD6_ASPVC|nr:hypothetical protein BO88DRAFT_444598 [Aspergillus vadensis CBS 113365]PYH68373.1 hypothetical protein BO88DRAFT_444598 [Aspergillus vadensis CBS 113365]